MKTSFEKKTARLLSVLGNPFRIKVLLAIGSGEACVCHLEAVLNQRQAYISQHLMALRKARLLETRREGKYIFYRLQDPEVLELVRKAAALSGLPQGEKPQYADDQGHPECGCPNCAHED